MAYTERQRQAILERDDHQNQMRLYDEDGGWTTDVDCEADECNYLQVHHITPQRILKNQGLVRSEIDTPENGLTLSACLHNGWCPEGLEFEPNFTVHPDTKHAKELYREIGAEAFRYMTEERNALVAQGHVYWDNAHDVEMQETAIERTQIAESQGWHFPPVRGLEEEFHHWSDIYFGGEE